MPSKFASQFSQCDFPRPAPDRPPDLWLPGRDFEPPESSWQKEGFLSILHSTLMLQAQQAGTPALLPLAAPSDTPMLIDSILWEVTLANPSLTTLQWGSFLDLAVRCGFVIGKVPLAGVLRGGLALTAGQIPIKLFSPARLWGEAVSAVTATPFARRAEWQPRYPIYVPAGYVLQPTVENLGYFGLALQVRVVYVVRLQAPSWTPPGPLKVPYVTAFCAPTIVRDGNAVTFTSDSKDLANPFEVPLHVDHVMGVSTLVRASKGGQRLDDERGETVDVSIVDSVGHQVVRPIPAVPFSQVFPADRHAMNTKPFVMQPQSYMTATIGCTQVVTGPPPWLVQAAIALSGWREETL